MPESVKEEAALKEIDSILKENGKCLQDFSSLPQPTNRSTVNFENQLILQELNYDKHAQVIEAQELVSSLNSEQYKIYVEIMSLITNDSGGFSFVYGYGGTGKTFLWKSLISSVRARGEIVLPVASSGIAATLLPGGRTAHSRFAIPLQVNETSVCNIRQNSPLAELIMATKLIIWDEAPMIQRYCVEALDRSLRDVMHCSSIFGGKCIVMGGDFRQILPVIPRGTREDIVFATINSSYLWRYCKVFMLTQNMRLLTSKETSDAKELADFAKWILAVGDGIVPNEDDTDDLIKIPSDFLLQPTTDALECIIHSTYPDLVLHLNDFSYFRDRAILTSTLSIVEEVNNAVLAMLPGAEKVYLSADSISKQDCDVGSFDGMHSTEFLNSIKMYGLPNHELRLKIRAPVILMRNIDKYNGLCNGTGLIVTRLEKHVIEASIISENNLSSRVLIPRITITPSDSNLPSTLCRRQFPIMLAFALTINKSQGQSLLNVGLYSQSQYSHMVNCMLQYLVSGVRQA